MKVKPKIPIIILINIVIALISLLNTDIFLITMILVIWVDLLIFSLDDVEGRSALFAFLISFFVFLIGREAMECFGIHEVEKEFSNAINSHAEFLVLISLIILFVGYQITPKRKKDITNDCDYNSVYYLIVRDISKKIFYVTFLFNIVNVADIALFVFRHGYVSFYTSYVSHVPYVIGKIGDMSNVALFIFLGTMPLKKESKLPIALYVVYLFITLFTGKRYPFVSGLLLLFVYFTARNKINSEEEAWFGKNEKKFCILSIPVLIVLLYFVNIVRAGNGLQGGNANNPIFEFLYDQGVNICNIKRGELYKDAIPDKVYMLGSTIEFLRNNFISRLLGIKSYSGNTIEHALYGNSFQHAISYIGMGKYYLAGHGNGSSYIAEAFHDLKYVGVIIINLIYGAIFKRTFNFSSKGIWNCAISLTIMYAMFLAPRGSADGFLSCMIDLTTWGTILVVYFLSRIAYNKARLRADSEPLFIEHFDNNRGADL